MKNKITYWCKTLQERNGSLRIVEIFLEENGLYRVYYDKNSKGLIFGSLEDVYEKFPELSKSLKEREVYC